jgi:cytochrome c553
MWFSLQRPFRVQGTRCLLVFCLAGVSGSTSQAEALPAKLPQLTHLLSANLTNSDDVIFAARQVGQDGHWYANFSYYAEDSNRKAYGKGGKLYRLNLRTSVLTTLLADPQGGVRDPQVHYDAKKILFSYRKGGTDQYHLYEINVDGTGLRQLTDGPYDDFEPSYLPDGGIVFVSSRCKRWVNCWLTQVAVMHRCDADGSNIRPLSSNNEQDNTPWPLPDGRLLYTRWEYVDRSQVDFHHLWTANPDGTSQAIWFGNLHAGTVMIDAKPVSGSHKIVASFSPGHGQREHDGFITLVDPSAGPDAESFAKHITKSADFRDPWAFSETCFLAARGTALVLVNAAGAAEQVFKLPEADLQAGLQCHEPRPLCERPRELVIPPRADPSRATGRMLLANVYQGRNMVGVKPGEIKKLLILETLPMPVHYTGGMEPISYGGTFTLERILGTVPVESDGSAWFELPALRSVFFVALDENDFAVKRMQSFTTVEPGEVLGCAGCHEPRTQTPRLPSTELAALKHAPSRLEPIAGVPDLIDFPRDIQPILDALCVDCHGYEKTARGGPRAGRLILSGDHGPMFSHSYYMLTVARLFSDGRNQPKSNYAPRTLGSSASRLLSMLDGTHYDVKATPLQKRTLRLWIESGAAYPGTYAALGCGMIGNYSENTQINTGQDWLATQAASEVISSRCATCHEQPARLLPQTLADERGVSFWQPSMDDPRLLTSRHIVFNLSRPDKSLMLLAPLAKEAGGWGLCCDPKTRQPKTVFLNTKDPGYRALLGLCDAGRQYLAQTSRRFDANDFQPRTDWIREMKRYGILPRDRDDAAAIDCYAVERKYWESLWYQPPKRVALSGQ